MTKAFVCPLNISRIFLNSLVLNLVLVENDFQFRVQVFKFNFHLKDSSSFRVKFYFCAEIVLIYRDEIVFNPYGRRF